MNRRVLIALLLLTTARAWADVEPAPTESSERGDETTSDQEWEAKGIIPHGGLTLSTQPITPITVLPDRNPYDQGLEELAQAQDLFKKENMEASSDVALQAYDDLMGVRMGRRNKKKRQKLRTERHQAATVYTDSSIAYIQDYVKRNGGTPHAIEEGRARLGDLRDVTQNYPELTRKLTKALEEYSVQPSTQTTVNVSSPSAPVGDPSKH